jgi:glycosyltransferase involved in cell wall biosynthesis
VSPLLSVIIPTRGRSSLARTLATMRAQAPAADLELLVVGDTHADTHAVALEHVPGLCATFDARYLPWDGEQHMYGHPQRNYGQAQATGQWLGYSQDDAYWLPGAWAAITKAIASGPRIPCFFRVTVWQGITVWRSPPRLLMGQVDADCLVVPNDPTKLGTWALDYCGDFEMLLDTVAKWRGRLRWIDAIISREDPRPYQHAEVRYGQAPQAPVAQPIVQDARRRLTWTAPGQP